MYLAANWKWRDADAEWRLETDLYLDFYNFWRGNPNAETFDKDFPHKFSLGEHSPLSSSLGESILVTESYDKMFHRLLLLRRTPLPSTEGVAIIGQPGTGASTKLDRNPRTITHRCIGSAGKTTFLTYMLVRLMAADQIVLLLNASGLRLFYHGKVYLRPAIHGFSGIPEHNTRYPIWTLVDVDSWEEGPPLDPNLDIWPIQASDPDPRKFASWVKKYGAILLGMPLWNMEELIEGYVFSRLSLSAINPGHPVHH